MSRARRGALSHQAGLAAEETAARAYQARGCAILARRWRCEAGEIDLIARAPDCLIFVEVKHRLRDIHEDPVTPKQWRRLEQAAETYILTAQTGQTPLRFDLVVVDGTGEAVIYENARETG